MPPSPTVDLQARDSSRAVDEILDEIDRLAASDLRESDFYAALISKIAYLGCPAIAVWTVEGADKARLVWSSPGAHAETNGDVVSLQRHENDVVAAIGNGQPKVIEPTSAANGTSTVAGR